MSSLHLSSACVRLDFAESLVLTWLAVFRASPHSSYVSLPAPAASHRGVIVIDAYAFIPGRGHGEVKGGAVAAGRSIALVTAAAASETSVVFDSEAGITALWGNVGPECSASLAFGSC